MNRRRFLQSTGAAGFLGAAGVSCAGRRVDADALPPFPIVDTHVHFWDLQHLDYPWVKGSPVLERSYSPEDYTAAIAPVAVEKVVFVEAACAAGQKMAEVEWVTALAEAHPRIQGIVANAPLERGRAVRPVLETLAANPLVKGIRSSIPKTAGTPPAFPSAFIEGVRLLERVGFTFEIGVGRARLPEALGLARKCPGVRFMINHIGVPDIAGGVLDPWRQHMRELAELPNVFCKMSGAATAADREHWTPEDLEPALAHVIECFGFERTAFGSDWPVMLLATSYPRWVRAAMWAVQGCSRRELRRLFRDTAIDFYRLPA